MALGHLVIKLVRICLPGVGSKPVPRGWVLLIRLLRAESHQVLRSCVADLSNVLPRGYGASTSVRACEVCFQRETGGDGSCSSLLCPAWLKIFSRADISCLKFNFR